MAAYNLAGRGKPQLGGAMPDLFTELWKDAQAKGITRATFDTAMNAKEKLSAKLQHLRQLWAPSAAWIAHIVRLLLRTVGGEFVEPIDQLGETFFCL